MHFEETKLVMLEADAEIAPLKKTAKKPKSTWRERIVIQAIICACLLAVFLGFNVIDAPFTNSVAGWVENNLSFNFLADEDGVGSWANRVVDIFRSSDSPAVNYVESLQSPQDSWIDPYILNEINTAE